MTRCTVLDAYIRALLSFLNDHTMSAPNLNTAVLLALHNIALPGEITSLDGANNRPRIPRSVLQKMDYVFAHADLRAALTAEIDDVLNNLESRVSPSSKKKRQVADEKWVHMVQKYEPDLPLDKVWDEEIVKKYYTCMLPILVSATFFLHFLLFFV